MSGSRLDGTTSQQLEEARLNIISAAEKLGLDVPLVMYVPAVGETVIRLQTRAAFALCSKALTQARRGGQDVE